MTERTARRKKGWRSAADAFVSVILTALIFVVAIYLSDELSEYVKEALLLSVKVIIPSVFPFLILTDVVARYIHLESLHHARLAFEKIFKINGSALSVYICGLLCGFPVGARLALSCYENGKISKDECERLMAFSNNASPGYVICAVGIGMRESVSDGVILYVSMILSSILTGFLFGIKRNYSVKADIISWQKYSFVNSIKSAAEICLNMTAFITAFGILSGILELFIKNETILTFLLSTLEIGNATLHLSDLCNFSFDISLVLSSFAISFSGLCVFCQTFSLVDSKDKISAKRYLAMKLVQGVFAMGFTMILNFFI